jgi:hypothetical protein
LRNRDLFQAHIVDAAIDRCVHAGGHRRGAYRSADLGCC